MPYSRFPPTDPPRRSRSNWAAELSLPTRLELATHGLLERSIATYGFVVWDVGVNRFLVQHGSRIVQQKVTQTDAHLYALIAGLKWLARQDLHRRRTVAWTESPRVYDQLVKDQPARDENTRRLAELGREQMRRFSQLELKMITPGSNQHASQLAAEAYVNAQEESRRRRVPAVLPDLTRVGDGVFRVGDRYTVDLNAGTCTCPDFHQMHTARFPIRCKHLLAAIQAE